MIQVHQDIAGIALLRIGLNVYVTAFPVAHAQEPRCSWMGELGRGPQPLSGKSSSGLVVDQADEIEIVGHSRDLAAHSPQGPIESTVALSWRPMPASWPGCFSCFSCAYSTSHCGELYSPL